MNDKDIKRLRKQLGWSLQKFATELGVSSGTVWRWENGKAKPSPLANTQLLSLKDKQENVK